MSKVEVKNDTVKLNAWAIIARAVEEGVAYGYGRAHKHGKPDEETLKNEVYNSVLNSLSEVLSYGD